MNNVRLDSAALEALRLPRHVMYAALGMMQHVTITGLGASSGDKATSRFRPNDQRPLVFSGDCRNHLSGTRSVLVDKDCDSAVRLLTS